MLNKIKNKIDDQFRQYLNNLDRQFLLSKVSPVLFNNIKDFVLRQGKRIRPTLFIIGYIGFAKRLPAGLYRCALSFELLHDFLLVHDDIIDRSNIRRGSPSLHAALNNYISKFKKIKFTGIDLSIVLGDIMYAFAIYAFLSVKEDSKRKEIALRRLVEAAIYTEMGEFIELLGGIRDLKVITKSEIYRIYDLKTAYYTFACPLAAGALLAGANKHQVDKLFKYGIYLGRAFQIKDDILSLFTDEKIIGKSSLTDIQEAKKTLLIWYAYNNSSRGNQLIIKNIFSKNTVNKSDLLRIRRIITLTGALDQAKQDISAFIRKAHAINLPHKMDTRYKNILHTYTNQLLSL